MNNKKDKLFEAFKENNGNFDEKKVYGGYVPGITHTSTPTTNPYSGSSDTLENTDQE